MKKRLFGLMSAAVIGLTTIATAGIYASAASVGQKLTVGGGQTRHKDVCDGYSYEIWLDNTGGSGSMTLGSGATFKAEWDASVSRGNFLARRGLDFGSTKKASEYDYIGLDYEADYKQTNSAQGNSRLCVYGWFQNQGVGGNVPLVEYYIIEDWVDWCPDAQGKFVTIDGAQYKIFQMDHTGPSINSGNETFKQYFSVRQDKRTSGHITVSEHFKAWEAEGWGIGNLYEVALNAEGWQSSGYADITKLDVYTTPGGKDITVTTEPIQTTTTQPETTTSKIETTTTIEETTTSKTTTEELKVTKAGDVNNDGNINISDAILLARVVAEDTGAKISDVGRLNAELDGKTGLSTDDLTKLLKMIAGIE